MKLKDACELLAYVEHEYPVNNINYKGLIIWPIIRLAAWRILTNNLKKNNKKHLRISKYFIKMFLSLFKRKENIDIKDALQKLDILFFAEKKSYSEKINDRYFNRVVDPIYQISRKKYSTQKASDCYLDSYFKTDFFFENNIKFSGYLYGLCVVIAKLNSLIRISRMLGISRYEFITNVMNSLSVVYSSKKRFSYIFRYIRPSVIMLDCYYSNKNIGKIWAAKELGIISVDIQHGKQGRYQGAYSHWTVIPKNGYKLLPSYFWVWGEESKRNIMQYSKDRATHKCITGGYPWLSLVKKTDMFNVVPSWFIDSITDKKVILVTLVAKAGDIDSVIPKILSNAISTSPDSWIWLLRMHPNHLYLEKEIRQSLNEVPVKKYMLGNINDISLYSILKYTDYHVTAYSSVLYEAEAFNVITSLFGNDAISLYGKWIKMSRFNHFTSSDQLITQINNSLSSQKYSWEGERYIESDEKHALYAIKQILRS